MYTVHTAENNPHCNAQYTLILHQVQLHFMVKQSNQQPKFHNDANSCTAQVFFYHTITNMQVSIVIATPNMAVHVIRAHAPQH